MGFVWVHADSFRHSVASPFHSFVTSNDDHTCMNVGHFSHVLLASCALQWAVAVLLEVPVTVLLPPLHVVVAAWWSFMAAACHVP